jgi:hypothetical protein
MILGHAVPMPVVIRTRPYDDAFYKAISPRRAEIRTFAQLQESVDELF